MAKYAVTLLSFALMICLAMPAVAGGSRLRCGNTVIKKGDSMYRVVRECGEPEEEKRVGEKTYGRVVDTVFLAKERLYVTEWIYDKGDFLHILTFEGSRLTKLSAERD